MLISFNRIKKKNRSNTANVLPGTCDLNRFDNYVHLDSSSSLPSPIQSPALHHLHFSRSQGGCSMMQQYKEKEKEPQYEKVQNAETDGEGERERWRRVRDRKGAKGGK